VHALAILCCCLPFRGLQIYSCLLIQALAIRWCHRSGISIGKPFLASVARLCKTSHLVVFHPAKCRCLQLYWVVCFSLLASCLLIQALANLCCCLFIACLPVACLFSALERHGPASSVGKPIVKGTARCVPGISFPGASVPRRPLGAEARCRCSLF
jgi:hypothetical protein